MWCAVPRNVYEYRGNLTFDSPASSMSAGMNSPHPSRVASTSSPPADIRESQRTFRMINGDISRDVPRKAAAPIVHGSRRQRGAKANPLTAAMIDAPAQSPRSVSVATSLASSLITERPTTSSLPLSRDSTTRVWTQPYRHCYPSPFVPMRSIGSRSSLLVQRVDDHTVALRFPMHVGAEGETGHADERDRLTALDMVADRYERE